MDATTMRSINWLVKRLRNDYSQFSFEPAEEFWWSAKKKTIYYDPKSVHAQAFCLHELSHALLDHEGYEYDIDLIKLERDAWQHAKSLSGAYDIAIDEEVIQNNLETYRTWLHARSTCPNCDATGLQMKDQQYHCLACGHRWRANEARLSALRRYPSITKSSL